MAFDRSNWSKVYPLSMTDKIAFDGSKTECEQVTHGGGVPHHPLTKR